MRAVIASTSSLSQRDVGELLGDLAARSRPTSPSRGAARCSWSPPSAACAAALCASLKAKRMMRSTPARVIIDTSVATSIGWPWCARPPTPAYSPSEFSRTMTQSRSSARQRLQRRVDAGQDARRPHVGVLVEALADRQPQAPQRDVVGDLRVAGRAEQDRVLAAAARPGRRPASSRRGRGTSRRPSRKSSNSKRKRAAGRGQRLQHLLAGGNHFLADAVAGDGGDVVGLHGSEGVCGPLLGSSIP